MLAFKIILKLESSVTNTKRKMHQMRIIRDSNSGDSAGEKQAWYYPSQRARRLGFYYVVYLTLNAPLQSCLTFWFPLGYPLLQLRNFN